MKKIGIVGWKIGENSFGVTIPYLTYFRRFGEVIVLGPYTDDVDPTINLLVLPGGADVDPMRYTRFPSLYTQKSDLFKEAFDLHVLPKYIDEKIPVFGICRGHQSLAVTYGIPLTQEIGSGHGHSKYEDRSEKVNNLKVNPEFAFLMGYKKGYSTKVNSLHHQGVDIETFEEKKNNEFISIATCTNYVEAMVSKDKPIASVQYHPEELGNDVISYFIIRHFLKNKTAVFNKKVITS